MNRLTTLILTLTISIFASASANTGQATDYAVPQDSGGFTVDMVTSGGETIPVKTRCCLELLEIIKEGGGVLPPGTVSAAFTGSEIWCFDSGGQTIGAIEIFADYRMDGNYPIWPLPGEPMSGYWPQ